MQQKSSDSPQLHFNGNEQTNRQTTLKLSLLCEEIKAFAKLHCLFNVTVHVWRLFAELQKDVAAGVSELSEEDVAVSYIGDELDLKTVGDIIAIIEDKVRHQHQQMRASVMSVIEL